MAVLVIGSANIDYTINSDTFLKAGETIFGNSLETFYGGKGANQAYAAAKISDDVAFIGAVGNDEVGREVIANFTTNNVECSHIEIKDNKTGSAFINVVDGENAIIVFSGANHDLSIEDIARHSEYIKTFTTIVMQLEISFEVVEYVMEIAKSVDSTIILDPAPSTSCTQKMLDLATFIKPNEYEYKDIKSRFNVDESKCIVTYGKKGVEYFSEGKKHYLNTMEVEAIDTTGAGDVFNGVFSAVYDSTKDIHKSIEEASKASAKSVTQKGAQVDFTK